MADSGENPVIQNQLYAKGQASFSPLTPMRLYPSIILLGTLLSSTLAWDEAGHEIVATIAQIHLHPSALPTICSILNVTSPVPGKPLCHLASVATWADSVRLEKRWSAPLHFVGAIDDFPSKTCLFPGNQGWEQNRNILYAMRNVTNLLDDFVKKKRGGIRIAKEDTELVNEALKFLIHFFGDLHQPLHLTGRNKGGNDVKVLFNGNQTNLHKVWDKFLVEKAIRTTSHKYDYPLADKRVEYSLRGIYYDRYIRLIVAEGILDTWKHDIPDWLSCPRSKFSKDAPEITTGRQHLLSWAQRSVSNKDPATGTDDEVLCPYAWAKKIHPLNCELAWPKELDQEPRRQSVEIDTGRTTFSGDEELELDTPEYSGVIAERKLVERLLAQGGIRLASTLNILFAEDI